LEVTILKRPYFFPKILMKSARCPKPPTIVKWLAFED
jgi:hypothetical protein